MDDALCSIRTLWLASEGAVVSSLLFPNSQWIDASGSFIWFHCSQLPTRPNHECSFATAQQTTAAFDLVEGHIGITGKRTILDDFQSPRSSKGKWRGSLVSIFMLPSQRFFDNSCIHRSDNVRSLSHAFLHLELGATASVVSHFFLQECHCQGLSSRPKCYIPAKRPRTTQGGFPVLAVPWWRNISQSFSISED